MIYLDNAATSFPKPEHCLKKALNRYLAAGASPGRGGYDAAVEAEAAVSAVRHKLAAFFGADNTYRVCFSSNATDALNLLLCGGLNPGDHVVSSRLEHNSVLRPLHHLKKMGRIDFDLVPFDTKGFVRAEDVAAAITPHTKMVIMTHASNVLGTVQPVAEIGGICRDRGVDFVLDVSQSAGKIPVRMKQWGVMGIAFTGHKSLLCPTGTGGLVLAPGFDLEPTRFGGTGIDSENLYHTMEYPHRLEAGTINLFGAFCLDECLDYVTSSSASALEKEMALFGKLQQGLARLPGVTLFGEDGPDNRLPILTVTVDGRDARDIADILDGDFGIAVRAGLHCAPLVHRDMGTAESGAVRFSLGPFTTESDIDTAISAMAAIAG